MTTSQEHAKRLYGEPVLSMQELFATTIDGFKNTSASACYTRTMVLAEREACALLAEESAAADRETNKRLVQAKADNETLIRVSEITEGCALTATDIARKIRERSNP